MPGALLQSVDSTRGDNATNFRLPCISIEHDFLALLSLFFFLGAVDHLKGKKEKKNCVKEVDSKGGGGGGVLGENNIIE